MTTSPSPATFAITSLLPHRGPMLLIDRLEYCTSTEGWGYATAKAGGIFTDAQGEMDGVMVVEMLAQMVAAYKGYEATLAGRSMRAGFLVGIKDFSLLRPPRQGEQLRLDLKVETAVGNATVISGRASLGSEELAAGTLNLWEMDESMPLPVPAAGAEPAKDAEPCEPLPCHQAGTRSPAFAAMLRAMHPLQAGAKEGEWLSRFAFGPSYPAFEGHFPQFQLLPGVVTAMTSLALAEAALGRRLRLVAVDKAKFGGMILPGDLVDAKTQLSPLEGGWQVRSSLAIPNRGSASFHVRVAEAR